MDLPERSPLRAHWSFEPELTFLNHGSFGACPTFVLDRQSELRALLERDPMSFFYEYNPPLWRDALISLSGFLGADPAGMTFQANATMGLATVLNSLPLGEGDEIVLADHAYAAFRNAIERIGRRTGAVPVTVPIPFGLHDRDEIVSRFRSAISARSRFAIVDTVTSPTASLMPFEALTAMMQGEGINVLVDAAHGPGLVPLDLSSLDAAYVVGNCHKWLCTPKGSAFLHVRADKRASVEPLITSHGYGARKAGRDNFREEFDWQGTMDTTPWLCVPSAIEEVGSLFRGGWPELMASGKALALHAREQLGHLLGIENVTPAEATTCMVTARLPPVTSETRSAFDKDPLMKQLYDEHRIQVVVFPWPAHQARYLRVSAAPYTSKSEIDALVTALEQAGICSGGH